MLEVNGHDIHQLEKNLKNLKNEKQKPSITICHKISEGKGFHFAENNPFWHHKNSFSDEEIEELNNCLR